MCEIKEQIDSLVEEIGSMTELFYQQQTAEGLQAFNQVVDKIMFVLAEADRQQKSNHEFAFDREKILAIFKEALQAMQEEDYVMMSDILQYDFCEYLQKVEAQMN